MGSLITVGRVNTQISRRMDVSSNIRSHYHTTAASAPNRIPIPRWQTPNGELNLHNGQRQMRAVPLNLRSFPNLSNRKFSTESKPPKDFPTPKTDETSNVANSRKPKEIKGQKVSSKGQGSGTDEKASKMFDSFTITPEINARLAKAAKLIAALTLLYLVISITVNYNKSDHHGDGSIVSKIKNSLGWNIGGTVTINNNTPPSVEKKEPEKKNG